MQVKPALPWEAGQRGEITLEEPITGADLANGALEISDTDGHILQPVLNDGYVDYYLDDTQVGSIQIGEDEEKTILLILGFSVGISRIQRVIPAIQWGCFDSNGDPLTNNGDTGFMVLQGNDSVNVGLVSQDGVNPLKVERTAAGVVRVYNNTQGDNVGVNTTLDSRPAPTTGPLANLPLGRCILYIEDNTLYFEVTGVKEQLQTVLVDANDDPVTLPYNGSLYTSQDL